MSNTNVIPQPIQSPVILGHIDLNQFSSTINHYSCSVCDCSGLKLEDMPPCEGNICQSCVDDQEQEYWESMEAKEVKLSKYDYWDGDDSWCE